MLKKIHRLPSSARLVRPRVLRHPDFSVKYSRNSLGLSRFGFVVRKPAVKKAVDRNRIRRVFRSCIEKEAEYIAGGFDMLFFLQKGIIDRTHPQVCAEVNLLLRRAKLLP
jgi:ribonuclease P protein component